jgi:outer membrane cobalamin receptor
MKLLLSTLLFAFFLTSPVWTQERISIEGRIFDAETGLPLPAAHALILHTERHAEADAVGRFVFYELKPGTYEIRFSHVGYQSIVQTHLVVTAESPLSLDVALSPSPILLPDVIVRADVEPSAGGQIGARIITQERLRTEQPQDLADLLEKSGYATVTSDGSPGGKRTVSLRGSASDQVTVLLNGQPLNSASDGIADLSSISLAEIRQVEIYPQSPAVYGAQAIGGVINIVTVNAGQSETRLQSGFSGYGEKMGGVTLGRKIAGLSVLSLFEHRESNGGYKYRVSPDDGLDVYTRDYGKTLTREQAGYRRDLFSLKLQPKADIEIAYRYILLHRQNPDYLPLPILPHSNQTDDRRYELSLQARAKDHRLIPALQIRLGSYRNVTTQDYGSQYPLLFKQDQMGGETFNSVLSWETPQQNWYSSNLGFGLDFERIRSSSLQSDRAQRQHEFLFFQLQGTPFHQVRLPCEIGFYTGARADLYRGDRAFVHPSLGITLRGGEALRWLLRAETGSYYHLPSFNSLFWQEDLQARGNPDLKPERSLNRETDAELSWKRWKIGASLFDRRVSDLIYWRLDFDNKWKPLNLYRAWIYGAEINGSGGWGKGFGSGDISISYRWLRAINQSGEANTDDNFLPYRPEHSATFTFKQDYSYFSADLAARWVSLRYTNEANTKSLSAYQVWDLGLTKEWLLPSYTTTISLRAEIRNLFNENYRYVANAPMPLREWWLSVQLAQNH